MPITSKEISTLLYLPYYYMKCMHLFGSVALKLFTLYNIKKCKKFSLYFLQLRNIDIFYLFEHHNRWLIYYHSFGEKKYSGSLQTKSFTSLMVVLSQDIKSVSSLSWYTLMEDFLEGFAPLRVWYINPNEKSNK